MTDYMTKKQKLKETATSDIKLSPELYWEWRCTINDVDGTKKDFDVGFLKHELMLKDQEIARLKSALFKSSLTSLQEKANLAKNEYEKMKKKIEDKIGISLNDCTITDTFEVKKLNQS